MRIFGRVFVIPMGCSPNIPAPGNKMNEFLKAEIPGAAGRDMMEFIRKVARSDKNVLILGETGTGKDVMARRIHLWSCRREKPFVAVNCANIPDELFEAELFGFARGAFTGAFRDKEGLLEAAAAGTAFLDEIAELPLHLQAKMLRVIEEKRFRRVGETVSRRIEARLVFATNKDLREEVKRERFRKDLYFRISVVKFFVPPLRERRRDIPLLARQILAKEDSQGKAEKVLTPGALKKLAGYNFPGNIRELENILERACLLSDGDWITEDDIRLDDEMTAPGAERPATSDGLRQTLESCRWNKTKAAREWGKSRRQFYRLLEKHGLADCIRRNYPPKP